MQRPMLSGKSQGAVAPGRVATGWLVLLLMLFLPAIASARDYRPGRNAGFFQDLKADVQLRALLRKNGVKPASDEDFARTSDERVELGNLLFYDKELSGNRDISCATCHHALMATADGLSLPSGVGGIGLATAREMGHGRERVPRNAPEVFNRAHAAFTSMFWDSRVVADDTQPSGFISPAGDDLPLGFSSALEVQAMFPVTSGDEMRGRPGENEIADAADNGEVWARLMDRLLAIDEYRDRFAAAFPDVPANELGFEHAAIAIAAFEGENWRADNSPFDRFMRGDRQAMSTAEKRGAILFYGKAGCVDCHAGTWQTDLEHHAIAMPQLGPGKGNGADGDEDFGRQAISGDDADLHKFRTPPLRNVSLTAPYGHAGAYGTLEEIVLHHLMPTYSLANWDRDQVLLPVSEEDDNPFSVMDDPAKVRSIANANELARTRLTDAEVAELVEFLGALTDPDMLDIRAEVPLRVPSGLSLAD